MQGGLTPLMLATYAYVLAGRLETVKFLANEGADLNAQSKASCPSLHAHMGIMK